MTNIKNFIAWCDRHGFPWKTANNKFYWQTNFQTGEIDLDTGIIKWHDKKFFNKVLTT